MTSSLDAVLAQYEQAQKNSSGGENRMSSEERMKKYFALILDEKSNSGTRRIRILPHLQEHPKDHLINQCI